MPPMNDEIALDNRALEAREVMLNERMSRTPEVIAANVHHVLCQRLREEAPSLLQELIAG